jgi:hypothetical protein
MAETAVRHDKEDELTLGTLWEEDAGGAGLDGQIEPHLLKDRSPSENSRELHQGGPPCLPISGEALEKLHSGAGAQGKVMKRM